ncbi:YncE family protein [Natrononativus amylolyticus]|uniref:YncE family protein n=1 Tax=Natrononativus amylolyticus TaxID=2963434 RepID=UPI0020CCBCAC|nr:hypothetical protein [Natrononativus amylolyticus]
MNQRRDATGADDGLQANPDRKNPFGRGIDRRRVLQSSAVVGTTATLSGCLSDDDERAPTMYVFNNGDRTVSVIDAETDELIESVFLGTTASFPANQYGTGAESEHDVLWLNVSGGVRGFDQRTLEEVAHVETGFGPNYPNVTPDEQHLIVAAGGTTSMEPDPPEPEDHMLFRVDADPDSDGFGDVTGELEVGYTGPCDMTLGPDSEYAFVSDVANETLTVIRVDPFEIAAQIDVGDPAGDGDVLPFMCTATFDGDLLLVENGEGGLGHEPDIEREGSESIWDISDPENPEEIERITRDDGLPAPPITSEIDPNNEAAYLFTPESESVTVIDLADQAVDQELDIGGTAIAGAWGPNREKLYVPVQTANQVAVIDHAQREVVATVEAGESPTGAVGGMVRPDTSTTQRLQGAIASLGVSVGDQELAYCPEQYCYCGYHSEEGVRSDDR